MKHSAKSTVRPETILLIEAVSTRHGIPPREARRLITKFLDRQRKAQFVDGTWIKLLDAQFQTRLGPYQRIRCGREKYLVHLTPRALCHDCGCAPGEYHVFGCDAEECSNCGGQAFCCDCGNTE